MRIPAPLRLARRCWVPVLAAACLLLAACSQVPADFPALTLEPSEFRVTQVEGGEVQASAGEVIISPRIRGRLKVVYLFPEGEQAEVGDLLIQFDPAEFEREMLDEGGQLEQARAEYDRAKSEMTQRLEELRRGIEKVEAQVRLSELSMQRAKLASRLDLERAEIELEKARRDLEEAHEEFAAQEVVNRVDLQKQEHEIEQRQQRYDRAKRDFDRTSLRAEKPGIVVYRKIWKPGTDQDGKVAVGDQVWGGNALLDIPDLSKMQVLCLIGEMDLKRMAVGQKALIRLEAFVGPVFHGEVARLAPMATPQPGAPDIQVFEMVVSVEERDPRLKPGMSAEVEVTIATVPNALSVPLNAVFEKDGRKVVYRRRGGGFHPVEVALGPRSATAVVVESGLSAGDVVALKDPASL
ncbi:MAG: efflux RND transporter periplasmic adaptor subunit [Candidatus Latescibacterota bacterium]